MYADPTVNANYEAVSNECKTAHEFLVTGRGYSDEKAFQLFRRNFERVSRDNKLALNKYELTKE